MTRSEIISQLKNYFRVEELVCPHTFDKFRDKSWQFLSTMYLHTLLVLRTEILCVPMIMNDYVFGGKNTQRGLRCNLCQLVKDKTLKNQIYLSAHIFGEGGDSVFAIKTGMTAAKARQLIKEKSHLLPYNVRIEKNVTWLHVDCYDTGVKVAEF